MEYPKVLVIGISAWRRDATAHTLENIFSCWDPQRLALIYTRSDTPDSTVASRYFQISETEVIRSVFRFWKKAGNEVVNSREVAKDAAQEHKLYAKAHKRHSYLLTLAREFVWALGHWKSKALRDFVQDFNPDIIFCPVYPVVYMEWIQRYVIQLTGKPYACYLADDNYSYDACDSVLSYLHRWWLRQGVKRLSTGCRQMFVIVDKEKEETDRLFGTNSVILTKGIDFSMRPFLPKPVSNPIRLVYTGSLIIGRAETIALIADIINELNQEGEHFVMDIYSQDNPEQDKMRRIDCGASHFCGSIGRDDIQRVQQEADVVIFAEALSGKESKIARLSFSTKITDYLSNGKCIVAVGKDDIAPIDYFRKYDSAIVATSKEELYSALESMMKSPEIISEYAPKAYACAVKNHEGEMMNNRFIQAMKNINE